jgi:hypothetical protein
LSANGGGLLDDVAEALREPPQIRGAAVVIEETPGGRRAFGVDESMDKQQMCQPGYKKM